MGRKAKAQATSHLSLSQQGRPIARQWGPALPMSHLAPKVLVVCVLDTQMRQLPHSAQASEDFTLGQDTCGTHHLTNHTMVLSIILLMPMTLLAWQQEQQPRQAVLAPSYTTDHVMCHPLSTPHAPRAVRLVAPLALIVSLNSHPRIARSAATVPPHLIVFMRLLR